LTFPWWEAVSLLQVKSEQEKSMLRFQVQGMTCGHCVQSVTKAVQAVDAKAQVEVDLAANSVSIEGSDRKDAIAEAIRAAGYEVLAA
jgi:copper chaperone